MTVGADRFPRSVAVVVLNWNGRSDLGRCLRSLRAVTGCTVVVVDNASEDGSADYVRAEFPEVALLEAPSNLGFSAGNNLGIRWALERDFAIVGILNNDTVVSSDFMEPLVRCILESEEDVFVSPQIRYLDRPGDVWFAGAIEDPVTGIFVHETHTKPPAAGSSLSPMITGCALFASRHVWSKVGLLDDGYFLIFEDAEWSVRATSSGCSGIVVHDSVILHAVSSTINSLAASDSVYYYCRNGVRFLRGGTPLPVSSLPFARLQLRRAAGGLIRRPSVGSLKRFLLVAQGLLAGALGRTGPRRRH